MRKRSSGRPRRGGISRRRFISGGAAVSAAALTSIVVGGAPPAAESARVPTGVSHIRLTINGVARDLEVADYATLAEVLRDHLGLTGVKIGCNRGECGACTVLLDGQAVYSCSHLAALADGREVTTIEGLARGDELDPVQQAFIDHDALQCGFCTPGQVMAARALLNANPSPSETEVRRGMSGNLCRCGCYNHIVAAVLTAAKSRQNG